MSCSIGVSLICANKEIYYYYIYDFLVRNKVIEPNIKISI